MFDLIHISDRLYIEHLYHQSLPKGLSEQEAEKFLETGKWAMLKIMDHPQLSLIAGRELAQTIRHELNLATEQIDH